MSAFQIARHAAFEPGRTALLILDMQRVWLEPRLCCTQNPWPDDHYFYAETSHHTIPNIQKLLATARRKGVEVIHVITQSLTVDGRECSSEHKLAPIHIAPGSPIAKPIAAVAPLDDEIVLTKTAWAAFSATNLDYLLQNMGIDCLILAGVMTDQCIDSSAREGVELGYHVTCVGDACAAASAERHRNALKALSGLCSIADSDAVSWRLRSLPPFPRAVA
jgi:nicotinamidase-related amidase